jgi:hypothetical protein
MTVQKYRNEPWHNVCTNCVQMHMKATAAQGTVSPLPSGPAPHTTLTDLSHIPQVSILLVHLPQLAPADSANLTQG